MSSESHFVHSASSEPGVTWAADSTTETDVGSVGKAGKHRMRRARVTKNLTSTLFGPDPTGDQVPPKTVIRCSYNKNDTRSYENIFGPPDPNARTRPLVHRFETATPTNTKQNLFGDPSGTAPPVGVSSSDTPHESTFDVLFGVPELVPNERRPYEEDTYSKLFGEPDTVPAGKDARENTQDNIFGPPIAGASTPPPQRPGSRSENTQEDLFGPPLPARAGRAGKTRDRSLLYLFKPEALDEPAPPMRTAMTRFGRINAETQDKLFGDPPKVPPPPPLTEDTTRNLFAPLEMDAEAKIAQYEENRSGDTKHISLVTRLK